MKKFIILSLTVFLISCFSNSKFHTRDSYAKKIIKSYNYLINKGLIDKKVIVSDTIKEINTSVFSHILFSNESYLRQSKLHDSLFYKDLSMYHKDYYYPVKKLLKNKTKAAKQIVFFF